MEYIPAHTTPAKWLDGDCAFTCGHDSDSESPIHWLEPDETFFGYDSNRGNYNVPDESPAAQVFGRLLDQFDALLALRILNRTSRIFGDGVQYQITSLPGAYQGHWLDILEPLGGSRITEAYEQWRTGQVYYVSCETHGYSIGGIYAEDEESAILEAKNYLDCEY